MLNYNPFSLDSKTILITGASSGIGRSIAIECSKLGAHVIITGRNKLRLNETFLSLIGYGHKQIIADFTDELSINNLLQEITLLNGIVHSAGIVNPKPFGFITRDDLDQILNVNLVGPSILTNSLLRKKQISKSASIVFISSISGVLISSVGGSLYSSSKGAINGMIKGMALDLASKQIRVNSVMPGVIETEIFEKTSVSNEDLIKDRIKYPLRRHGTPKDVAYATIFLLSDASSWITGTNLLIDGGFTLM